MTPGLTKIPSHLIYTTRPYACMICRHPYGMDRAVLVIDHNGYAPIACTGTDENGQPLHCARIAETAREDQR